MGQWTLEVTGLVDEPLSLTLDALQRDFELVEEASVLTCVSNPVGGPLVGSSRWTGVRLGDVLRRSQPRPTSVEVVLRCADGYDVSVPLARALESSALLAIGHEGRLLRQEHGFPCRLRVPALYGMMNAKWIEEVRLVDVPHRSYWTERGWSDVAEVRTQSRVDVPRQAALGRRTWIAGVAWAGTSGISGVEVSVDGGANWRPARLRRPIAAHAWTQWALEWLPERRGIQRVACRAVAGDGTRQDARRRPPHPAGVNRLSRGGCDGLMNLNLYLLHASLVRYAESHNPTPRGVLGSPIEGILNATQGTPGRHRGRRTARRLGGIRHRAGRDR